VVGAEMYRQAANSYLRITGMDTAGAGANILIWSDGASAGNRGRINISGGSAGTPTGMENEIGFSVGGFSNVVIIDTNAKLRATMLADINGNTIISSTAPTIASGFGTSPSILANNTAAFQITVGSGGTASQGQITMPAAPNGWACHAQGNGALKQIIEAIGTSTTNILLSNVDPTTGLPLAWAAGSIIQVMCMAY
jgi:hypothetical protein